MSFAVDSQGRPGLPPFGNIAANYGSAPTGNHYTFTGYESDTADSSTDYAQFRNLSLNLGRFNRPDPYMGSYDFSNPQSLNRYSYVMNRPMMLVDPAGLDYIDSNGNLCTQWDDDSGAANVTCMTGLIDLASYFWGGPGSGGYLGSGDPSHTIDSQSRRKECSESEADVVRDATLSALSKFSPNLNQSKNVSSYTPDFAKIANPSAIPTGGWAAAYSTHAIAKESPVIPGQGNFVLKLYSDPKLGNTMALVYPSNSLLHYMQFPLYAAGMHSNAGNARAYFGCPGWGKGY